MEETTYELRRLEARDIAPMASIINKIGWREFKETFQSEEVKAMALGGTENASAAGMTIVFDIVGIILGNYEKCQKDIFGFLSSLSGMKGKQIESMPLADFAGMIVEVVQKEDFKDFMKVVSKLFK